MSEFAFIDRYLAPLSQGASGAMDLTDDAALLDQHTDVIACDALVEGVHFLKTMPLDIIARRALRTNLSDMAAMGAKPSAYLMSCVWPKEMGEERVSAFADGLRQDQEQFKVHLIGGDTTAHTLSNGPFTVSITILGVAPKSGVVTRSGASPGDDVYVSGTIGDAGLGLSAIDWSDSVLPSHRDYLIDRYQLPQPRLSLGSALAGVASSMIDISDGLIADAEHLAKASNTRLQILLDKLPKSPAAEAWISAQEKQRMAMVSLATLGDDYELLFTAPPARHRAVEMASQLTKTKITKIGSVQKGEGVETIDTDGAAITIEQPGFNHFSTHS